MAVVHGVALVTATSLEVLQDGHCYTSLLQIAHMLHGQRKPPEGTLLGFFFTISCWCLRYPTVSPAVLVALPVSESPVQLQILTLCEVWWEKNLQEKEKFALTALLVSLRKCFSLKKVVSVSVQLQKNFQFIHSWFLL